MSPCLASETTSSPRLTLTEDQYLGDPPPEYFGGRHRFQSFNRRPRYFLDGLFVELAECRPLPEGDSRQLIFRRRQPLTPQPVGLAHEARLSGPMERLPGCNSPGPRRAQASIDPGAHLGQHLADPVVRSGFLCRTQDVRPAGAQYSRHFFERRTGSLTEWTTHTDRA
jgi:hypothetical protein